MKNNMQIEPVDQPNPENLPIKTYLATLENKQQVRTVIIKNNITGEMDAGYILIDVADALSYDRKVFKRIYMRSNWLKKYLRGAVTAPRHDGKMAPHDIIIGKEGLVGGFMKLQTSRIKDEAKRARIDLIQEQLVKILVKVLSGYRATLSKQARMDKAMEDLNCKARIEMMKAVSGSQIKEIMKAYGPYTGKKVLNIMFGIKEKDLEFTNAFISG